MGNSNTLRYGTYWTVRLDQLLPGETIDSGYYSAEAAMLGASTILPDYEARIELLDTLESNLAWDDLRFDETQIISSKRWCVIVKIL